MRARGRVAGLWARVARRGHLGELQETRARLARISDSIEENRKLRPTLEARVDSLAGTVLDLAERRTNTER